MIAPEEIATEQWAVEPYPRDEVALYILSGGIRILSNVNLDIDEMVAITALPELFRLAFAVLERTNDVYLKTLAKAALDKAAAKEQEG